MTPSTLQAVHAGLMATAPCLHGQHLLHISNTNSLLVIDSIVHCKVICHAINHNRACRRFTHHSLKSRLEQRASMEDAYYRAPHRQTEKPIMQDPISTRAAGSYTFG